VSWPSFCGCGLCLADIFNGRDKVNDVMNTWQTVLCVLLLQPMISSIASDAQRTIPQFKSVDPVRVTLEYRGDVKGWDGSISVEASGRAMTVNNAIMRLFNADGKEVPPIKGRVSGYFANVIANKPFNSLINLAQCYDLSKTGKYRFEWGCRIMGDEQVETGIQSFEFEIIK
jgi:hypothetical protein